MRRGWAGSEAPSKTSRRSGQLDVLATQATATNASSLPSPVTSANCFSSTSTPRLGPTWPRVVSLQPRSVSVTTFVQSTFPRGFLVGVGELDAVVGITKVVVALPGTLAVGVDVGCARIGGTTFTAAIMTAAHIARTTSAFAIVPAVNVVAALPVPLPAPPGIDGTVPTCGVPATDGTFPVADTSGGIISGMMRRS